MEETNGEQAPQDGACPPGQLMSLEEAKALVQANPGENCFSLLEKAKAIISRAESHAAPAAPAPPTEGALFKAANKVKKLRHAFDMANSAYEDAVSWVDSALDKLNDAKVRLEEAERNGGDSRRLGHC